MDNSIYQSGSDYDLEYTGYVADLDFLTRLAQKHHEEGSDLPVLEFACGTGRVTYHLAEKGFPVIGVDLSEAMLAEAQRKMSLQDVEVQRRVSLYTGDMRRFKSPIEKQNREHNLILVPFTAFLHLTTPADQKKALVNFSSHLKKRHGHIMVDIFNPQPEYLARGLAGHTPILEKEVVIDGGTRTMLRYVSTKYQTDKQLFRWDFLVEIYDNKTGELVRKYRRGADVAVIFPNEWRTMLHICGFTIRHEWGGYNFQPFTSDSRRMLFLAQRTHEPLIR